MDTLVFKTDQLWLEENLSWFKSLIAQLEDVSIWELVVLKLNLMVLFFLAVDVHVFLGFERLHGAVLFFNIANYLELSRCVECITRAS